MKKIAYISLFICLNIVGLCGGNVKNREYLSCDYSIDSKGNLYYRENKIAVGKKDKVIVEDCYYAIYKKNIYYKGNQIYEVDYKTFVVLDYGYSKDKNHIYYDGIIFKDANTSSFKIHSSNLVSDKNNVYYKNNKVDGVDMSTFKYEGCYHPYGCICYGDETISDKNGEYAILDVENDSEFKYKKIEINGYDDIININ